jgi:hypothetical protein
LKGVIAQASGINVDGHPRQKAMTASEQFWWLTPSIYFLSLMALRVLSCITRQLAQ